MHAQALEIELPEQAGRLLVEVSFREPVAGEDAGSNPRPYGYLPSDCCNRTLAPDVRMPLERIPSVAGREGPA